MEFGVLLVGTGAIEDVDAFPVAGGGDIEDVVKKGGFVLAKDRANFAFGPDEELALFALAGPAAAAAAQASPLSPRLVVLSSPQVRSLGVAKQARRVGLTRSGAGSLLRQGRRVIVDVRFAGGAAARAGRPLSPSATGCVTWLPTPTSWPQPTSSSCA